MAKRTRVPVRVRRVPSAYETMRDPYGRLPARARRPAGTPAEPVRVPEQPDPRLSAPARAAQAAVAPKREAPEDRAVPEQRDPTTARPVSGDAGGTRYDGAVAAESDESTNEWRDRALRLQAEIENFRKRQKRLSQERIRDDRERLLRAFLAVGDDLERALETDGDGSAGLVQLREGVELTHRGFLQMLEREGVEPIEALGQQFDPVLHDGIATIPHKQTGLRPNTVAKVVENGYRIGERLLRPARVIVTA